MEESEKWDQQLGLRKGKANLFQPILFLYFSLLNDKFRLSMREVLREEARR